MAIHLCCPHCGTTCLIEQSAAGATARCGRCGKVFSVPPVTAAATMARVAPSTVSQSINPVVPQTAATPRSGSASLRLDVAAVTSSGRRRPTNEDSFLVHQLSWAELDTAHEIALVVVADGLGGHQGGAKASSLLINIFNRALSPLLIELMAHAKDAFPLAKIQQRIHGAFRGANHTIHRFGQTQRDLHGMGATAVALLLSHNQVAVAHVGDCRVYHGRAQKLTPMTRDHTRVAQLIEQGRLRAADAANHPQRNEITQAVGTQKELVPSFHHWQLFPGDWLIAASDGLGEHVDDATLLQAFQTAPSSAAVLAQHLVSLANQGGGTDNCTVAAVRCYV